MNTSFTPRFDRSFRKLSSPQQKTIFKVISNFTANLQKGSRPQGQGLRRLHDNIWEIRMGLALRVLFELGKDELTFIFVGTHDEVRRFLKSF